MPAATCHYAEPVADRSPHAPSPPPARNYCAPFVRHRDFDDHFSLPFWRTPLSVTEILLTCLFLVKTLFWKTPLSVTEIYFYFYSKLPFWRTPLSAIKDFYAKNCSFVPARLCALSPPVAAGAAGLQIRHCAELLLSFSSPPRYLLLHSFLSIFISSMDNPKAITCEIAWNFPPALTQS